MGMAQSPRFRRRSEASTYTAKLSVIEVPDTLPNIIGQIPLEDLDWVVDCRNQKFPRSLFVIQSKEMGNQHLHSVS